MLECSFWVVCNLISIFFQKTKYTDAVTKGAENVWGNEVLTGITNVVLLASGKVEKPCSMENMS